MRRIVRLMVHSLLLYFGVILMIQGVHQDAYWLGAYVGLRTRW